MKLWYERKCLQRILNEAIIHFKWEENPNRKFGIGKVIHDTHTWRFDCFFNQQNQQQQQQQQQNQRNQKKKSAIDFISQNSIISYLVNMQSDKIVIV